MQFRSYLFSILRWARLCLFLAALATDAAAAPLFGGSPCFQLAAESKPPTESALTEMAGVYRDAQKNLTGAMEEAVRSFVDPQRLINRRDWIRALEADKDPALAYSEATITDWRAAADFVQSLPRDVELSVDLYKQIHALANKSNYYRYYEAQRIRASTTLTARQKSDLLHRMYYQGERIYTQGDHQRLGGVFRQDPKLDVLIYNGEHELAGFPKRFYMTGYELGRLRANKHFRVAEETIQEIAKNQFTGDVYFTAPEDIPRATRTAIATAAARLKKSGSLMNALEAVAELERALIAIHPFYDGVGRATRLFGDLILERYGLPPPLYPAESDFFMSPREMTYFLNAAMKNYNRELTAIRQLH